MKTQFHLVPEILWPTKNRPDGIKALYVNRDFLVQQYEEKNGIIRLTINIVEMGEGGRWKDGISWDQLQEIKNALGFADRDAVEIYPAAADVVNVANMRHLWVMPEPLDFAWRKGVKHEQEIWP